MSDYEPDQIDMMDEHELRKELRELVAIHCNTRQELKAARAVLDGECVWT